ncbi:MAG: response regulator transcription factor [bacterium]|nr:response regulator transcription factor [bacterium]
MPLAPEPITIAVVNDHPVVVAGVAKMLEGDDRISVVELDSMVTPELPVDVVLFDGYARPGGIARAVQEIAQEQPESKIVVFSWNVESPQIEEVLAVGADSYLSKALTPDELADALVRVGRGEQVIEPAPVQDELSSMNDWPGRDAGLSPRESEVVALITAGLTNDEIARSCYLSINSVKTYIRSAYRKMGVERRSQAVAWGIENGMVPRALRQV